MGQKYTEAELINLLKLTDKLNVLSIITEGETDIKIARSFLDKAGIPLKRIKFVSANGISTIRKIGKNLNSENFQGKIAILVDQDINSNFEAENLAKSRLNTEHSDVSVFTAVPAIESWLFSDIESVRSRVQKNKRTDEILSRLPLPDDIPHPKHLANSILRLKNTSDLFISEININIAISRSPSLRKFIFGVCKLLSIETKVEWEKEYVRTAGRDIFSKLVDEVTPPNSVIYKTLDGVKITAQEMSKHIHDGSDIGLKYSVDVLRIARDMLARSSRK